MVKKFGESFVDCILHSFVQREEKYTNRRMRLQSLATRDWHFDGSYENFTLIGLTTISASLLYLFTFQELLSVQK